MKTVKKPTKAHKNKKVVKAHQGMAHVPKSNTTSTAPTRAQPSGARAINDINAGQVAALNKFNEKRVRPTNSRRVNPNIVSGEIDGRGQPLQLTPYDKKERETGREIARRMDGNKVVQRSKADTKRRAEAEIKRRGGRDKLRMERLVAALTGGKRPARIDPYRGMDERAKRRAMNAAKSEYDETTRQVRKDMGTQRKPVRPRQPTAQPIRQPTPLGQPMRLPKDFGGRKPRPIQPRQQPPLIGTPISFPQRAMSLPRQPNKTKPFSLGPLPENFTMNKGGAVKKKYSEVKTLKQGGYVSRAKYGSVDNLKKKK